MKLEAVQLSLPSKVVSNSDILTLIKKHAFNNFEGSLEDAIKEIDFYLKYSGSQTRYWLGENETPISLLRDAGIRAMRQAEVSAKDIDLLIYVGIGRGFIEPGGAYHASNALDLGDIECFDIIDACMSWTRAMHISQALISAGTYKRIMVVNAEFNMLEGGAIYPDVFKLKNKESVEWTFPSFTLGEAASATIVCADDLHGQENSPWTFEFESRPDLADLCNIPIHAFEGYSLSSERIGKNGCGRFTSYGAKLVELGRPHILEVMQRLGRQVPLHEAKALFTHASSKRDWQNFAIDVGLRDLLHTIYPKTGNIVSASIPGAIALAVKEFRIERGDRILGWVGSAGMSYAAFSFIY